jgi:hypothetical protein
LFEQLDPINGKISGAKAKREMVKVVARSVGSSVEWEEIFEP